MAAMFALTYFAFESRTGERRQWGRKEELRMERNQKLRTGNKKKKLERSKREVSRAYHYKKEAGVREKVERGKRKSGDSIQINPNYREDEGHKDKRDFQRYSTKRRRHTHGGN